MKAIIEKSQQGWLTTLINEYGNLTHTGGKTLAQALYEAFKYQAPTELYIKNVKVELPQAIELAKTKNGFYSKHIAEKLK